MIASISHECVSELATTGSATAQLTAFGQPSVVVVTVTQSAGPTLPIPVASGSSTTTSTSSSGLSSGAIAGIAVGAVVGAAVVAGAIFLLWRRGTRDNVAPRVEETQYPAPYDGGYPQEPKPEVAGTPSTGLRYLDPDAANTEIPSGRTLGA